MVCENMLYGYCFTLPLLCTAIIVLYLEFAGTVASNFVCLLRADFGFCISGL